ncbi:hypothetical protein BABINDRAFT_159193 [Babjeviella inositovora NRRL Y-12698]|uniref:Phosphoribulokinase/uridine kinase domain-containing protein n=1 Tax=Babjeviella inositovora NRRL Y-12698 TaxID=984486 RepID=A0A1E3QZZ8_9ASCO|nr:uncharacterized protein BABINDRAFT_159193 [Babjeviella inositovora NRRL Y-12698]ODQ82652.1 hypothetical protein BABINDRAFT_159193 [Babjeviella inositovora NRRL Y-12698]
MDKTYTALANRALQLLETSGTYRVLVFLVGTPGSGKSSVAHEVASRINVMHRENGFREPPGKATSPRDLVTNSLVSGIPMFDPASVIDPENEALQPHKVVDLPTQTTTIRARGLEATAIDVVSTPVSDTEVSFVQVAPMDGFHLPRNVLDQFSDLASAHFRRGSEWTFDSTLVVTLVDLLQACCVDLGLDSKPGLFQTLLGAETGIPLLAIPTFDHELKDPTPRGTVIQPETRIVIVEGLYLLLKIKAWSTIHRHLSGKRSHETWKIDVSEEACRERVAKRHLRSGLVETYEKGVERYDLNDVLNGRQVELESWEADVHIDSVDGVV